ncbi:hypothetical protein [Roseiconus lacunae]|uniref:Chromosome partition protein Smc n=1 Tax=Roseiconus lacunae TaxID=2605694 RepID=A0ABT7PK34_9BACT|nr:hypothetical protein [Roseiconus lacunae]MCD0461811.1 hypothetical protein [Roseiconus lacunae]MDM4016546.1 hypothetical protein [Roseiconus lacunae]WRQ49415.1 hypothetical protein U8335_20960 [Stieleria sp. HD01]
MTLLGKAFTVVILLLSITFMGLALAVNASHRNWRDVVLGPAGYKAQIEAYAQQNEQLQDAQQRAQSALSREQVARRTALAALQTQLDQLSDDLATRINTIQKLDEKLANLTQTDKIQAEQLQDLTDANKRLREQVSEEQKNRDELFAQTLVLQDQLSESKGVRLQLKERNDNLQAELVRFREVADHMGIDPQAPLDGAPPDRNGNVLVVTRNKGLVEVSIGQDDGLRAGHQLDVTRDDRYIGRLRVVKTEPDRAVAEIMKDYSEGFILEGDRVDTSLE